MGFNIGGFLGGVSEGVNDAILREEERLDEKLTMNRQEASLQRRDKNKERLRKEVLLEELTEQLAVHHTEDQIAQMSAKGLGAMKQFATISQAEFAAGRDPSAAYNWSVATAELAPPPMSAQVDNSAKSDDLEKTTIKPTSFGLKRPTQTYKSYATIDESLERNAQAIVTAQQNGDKKKLAELQRRGELLMEQALTQGDGSQFKDASVTSVLNYSYKTYMTGLGYDYDNVENKIANLTTDMRGQVIADNYGYGQSLLRNKKFAADGTINSIATNHKNDANINARAFADKQYVNRGEGLYFQPAPSSNYHVIPLPGVQEMNRKEQGEFMKSQFQKYKQTNKVLHGSTVIYQGVTADGKSYKAAGGVYSRNGDRIIG
jgi:hypothetical protein|tara:strand:- start:1013 stop:2137 length:1125 start_codon:yes stop_codon:yes gene_type:complete